MARRKIKGDVMCFVRGRKRPIVYCTLGANETIAVVSEDGCTIQEAYNRINYDHEAKDVLKKYIALGHGGDKASDYFTFEPPPCYSPTPPELIGRSPSKKTGRTSKKV